MPDDQRVYSDEEFALILRQVTELGSRETSPGTSSAGLTLTEMKAIASQVGLDPALVERAARMLVVTVPASPFERLIGGPLRHRQEIRLPATLDKSRAAKLLSAVRIGASLAGHQDVGHSGSMGMTWHDGGDTEALRVAARPEGDETVVSVDFDRSVTLGLVGAGAGVAGFLAVLFAASALYPEAPALGYGGLIAGVGGVLAVARGYWASSTRRAQERMSAVMDVIGRTLDPPEITASGRTAIGEGSAGPTRDARMAGDAELTEA